MRDLIQAIQEGLRTFQRVREAQRISDSRARAQSIRWASATEQELARWGRSHPQMAAAERQRRGVRA